MLKDNLMMLRTVRGYSQEEIAEKISISRQAYAKWESGVTIPDVEKCSLLADVYGVTIDSLIKGNQVEGIGAIPPAPVGKSIWGTVTVNDRGQIVIPKGARDKFGINSGTRLIVAADEVGIALIPVEAFEEGIRKVMKLAYTDANKTE
ncbi:MAG: helix-turn-helix domain-containing protein [Oscillospiraceae bacterium]|jgi:AbrB family looped-hinge helix DNA binding protein|nr:helix-turn-helix domain-containing protein [Oscillospiraceae bacterium]